jgi:uncharacterized protein (TIGR02466 family)
MEDERMLDQLEREAAQTPLQPPTKSQGLNTHFGELLLLFPTAVVKNNIGRSFTKEEMDCFLNIPMRPTKVNNNETHAQSLNFDVAASIGLEELKDIRQFCEAQLKNYMEEIEGIDTDRAPLKITQSWVNRIVPQGYHSAHNHKNSYLSGVLYIKCLPNDSIQFTNRIVLFDTMLEFPKKKITDVNAEVISVSVQDGDFIIFPSLVPHQVGINETDDIRMSLSFDTFPAKLPSLYPPFK